MSITPQIRQLVRQPAEGLCEYRHIADAPFQAATGFNIEHINPKAGYSDNDPNRDHPDNLCWACPKCNSYKGDSTAGMDPETGAMTRLFNPREDKWSEHFVAKGAWIVGTTSIGKTTVEVLRINEEGRVRSRLAWLEHTSPGVNW